MELGDAQKSSPEAFESLEDDLKIKNLDVQETIEKHIYLFLCPKASGEFRFASKKLAS